MASADEASCADASENGQRHHVAVPWCVRWRACRQRCGAWCSHRRGRSTSDQHDCARSDHPATDRGGANDDHRHGRSDRHPECHTANVICGLGDGFHDHRGCLDHHHRGTDHNRTRLRRRTPGRSALRRSRRTAIARGPAATHCLGYSSVDCGRLEVRPGHRSRSPPLPGVAGLDRRRRCRANHPGRPGRSSRRRASDHAANHQRRLTTNGERPTANTSELSQCREPELSPLEIREGRRR